MSERQDIDIVLQQWPFQPGVISARIVKADDGREVLQMRIELGVLQMELEGRPDGQPSYLDKLEKKVETEGAYVLTEDECFDIDREFLQYYHRRICCLALREFQRAMADAEHTLRLLDFVTTHSPDREWTQSHEQYRPFVLFHRAQAAAMLALDASSAEAAIEEINKGLDDMRKVFSRHDADEQFEMDELVGHLRDLKESLRREYEVGQTLAEQLADAVAAEEYERAARLRDEIARRHLP